MSGGQQPCCVRGTAAWEQRLPDSKSCPPILKAGITSSCLGLLYFSRILSPPPLLLAPWCFLVASSAPLPPHPHFISSLSHSRSCWPTGSFWSNRDLPGFPLDSASCSKIYPPPPSTPTSSRSRHSDRRGLPYIPQMQWGWWGCLLSVVSELGGGRLFPNRSLLRNPPSTRGPAGKTEGFRQRDIS